MKRIGFYSIAAAVVALAGCSADVITAPEPSVNLGTCTTLAAPAGTKQLARVFAGKAPVTASSTGEVRSIPYTAKYFFYRPL